MDDFLFLYLLIIITIYSFILIFLEPKYEKYFNLKSNGYLIVPWACLLDHYLNFSEMHHRYLGAVALGVKFIYGLVILLISSVKLSPLPEFCCHFKQSIWFIYTLINWRDLDPFLLNIYLCMWVLIPGSVSALSRAKVKAEAEDIMLFLSSFALTINTERA